MPPSCSRRSSSWTTTIAELGILLYLAETGMSSMVLLARTVVSLRSTRRRYEAGAAGVSGRQVSQLLKARELTTWTVVVAVGVLPLLTMGVLAIREGPWDPPKSTLGLVGIFVTLRLIVDVSQWRTASRAYVRRRSFGRLAEEEPPPAGRARRTAV